jgi:hypothetical protein
MIAVMMCVRVPQQTSNLVFRSVNEFSANGFNAATREGAAR